ncbi:hypothetical protein BC962_1997 [Gillisia mitskevichiae]|uniref:Uncharacterized protein n=1 Tax=Gillisia mitskevichiae TaxID=270921 RepID=A0A495PSZ4_9FLAO|nr:hypothetical protein [Gillisia mitskevichiae]RKS53743.1 hypothetical protein BC962_1997 [Gillisia mitskevichiae]
MMLFNTTDTNKSYLEETSNTVGKAFSFVDKIKMGGVSSGKLEVAEFSAKLEPKDLLASAVNYATIVLRPKGVIVHFRNDSKRYSWIIPYYRLVIYNTRTFTIHANGHFIKLKRNKNYQDNKKFLDKMIDLKNESLNLEYYDG